MPERRLNHEEQKDLAHRIFLHLDQIRTRLWQDDCEDVMDDVWPDLVRVRDLVYEMIYGKEEE
jgi:hypothetical protein